VKYIGVSISNSVYSPYRADLWVNGKNKHLGNHLTAQAAARAYDAVASTIPGRQLNFPDARRRAAAAV
jgi:uncharacterized membrane protein